MGDPAGIGAEVLCAALCDQELRTLVRPLVFGDDRIWSAACERMGVVDDLRRIQPGDLAPPEGALVEITKLSRVAWGEPSAEGGKAQKAYLEAALKSVTSGQSRALCTGPIHKASIRAAGFPFPGHTEFLQEALGAERVVMMLAGPRLRVALATTHLPLSEVPSALDRVGLLPILEIVDEALRSHFKITAPRIAVCGLNPHAGEEGLFGNEEQRVIAPAIEEARARGIRAEGPFPADGLFPRAAEGGWDAVLAMYHDQGLIPVKTVHRATAVNITLGLPIVRTSPDHGVAFDIAGTGKADPTSALHALRLAAQCA